MAVRYPIPALPQTFNGRESMRSIADACERLREEDQSPSGSLTQVRTFPFTLPSSALLREPSVSVEREPETPRLGGWGARIRTWDHGTKARCLTAWPRPNPHR